MNRATASVLRRRVAGTTAAVAAAVAAAVKPTEAAALETGIERSSCVSAAADCLQCFLLSPFSYHGRNLLSHAAWGVSPAFIAQQRVVSSVASAAAVAAAETHCGFTVPECHLAAAAAAARFALLRQLHDAAFWRDLGAAAEALLEAIAAGQYTELSPSSSSSSSKARGVAACRSSGAATEVLSVLMRIKQQQQQGTAAAAAGGGAGAAAAGGWCIDTRNIGLSLSVLVNSFKQMRVYRLGLFAAAERAGHLHLHALSLHAVSLICCSFAAAAAAGAAAATPSASFMLAAGNHCVEAAAAAAAGPAAAVAACSSSFYALPPKLQSLAASAAAEEGQDHTTAAGAAAASAAAYFHFVSWCHLLGAFARCGIPHQGLFETGAPHLCAVLQRHRTHLLLLQQRQQQQLLLQQASSRSSGSNSTHRQQQIVSPGALVAKALKAYAT